MSILPTSYQAQSLNSAVRPHLFEWIIAFIWIVVEYITPGLQVAVFIIARNYINNRGLHGHTYTYVRKVEKQPE